MSEAVPQPESRTQPSPLEVVSKLVDNARSTLTDRKKLALITAGAGLAFLTACSGGEVDNRQFPPLEIRTSYTVPRVPVPQQLERSGEKAVQQEKERTVAILREVINDDILKEYNNVELQFDNTLVPHETSPQLRTEDPRLKGITLHRKTPKGPSTWNNIPLFADSKHAIQDAIASKTGTRIYGSLATPDSKNKDSRDFVPPLRPFVVGSTIPTENLASAAKVILKVPDNAKIKNVSDMVEFDFSIQDGRRTSAIFDQTGRISISVASPQSPQRLP